MITQISDDLYLQAKQEVINHLSGGSNKLDADEHRFSSAIKQLLEGTPLSEPYEAKGNILVRALATSIKFKRYDTSLVLMKYVSVEEMLLRKKLIIFNLDTSERCFVLAHIKDVNACVSINNIKNHLAYSTSEQTFKETVFKLLEMGMTYNTLFIDHENGEVGEIVRKYHLNQLALSALTSESSQPKTRSSI